MKKYRQELKSYKIFIMAMIPNSKPKLTQVDALKEIAKFSLQGYDLKILGVRGYYKTTMGNPVQNDRGIYDDAIFLISPDHFSSWNANTDPSVTRKGVAVLKPGGPYLYKLGLHNMQHPYLALRQYGRVTVVRDQQGEETDTPAAPFYIDIHRGGVNTTSSLGCQTIHPSQWDAFLATVKDQLNRHKQTIVPYCLIEQA